MSNYKILENVLDKIIAEAPSELKSYHNANDELKINQARARAYIHLFLKANLGILNFTDREEYITDGPQDGGIDGYFIDSESKCILFIQSKFRTNKENFENKEISLEEVLKMDIDRILTGEINHENGAPYNSKVLRMQRRLKEIRDIARYRYEVVILANLKKISADKLRQLTAGIPAVIYDYKRTFSDLVFPVVTGSFYQYSDLFIDVNLSDKSTGAHISYSVETSQGDCDITVLFVPLIEIGEIMYKYKNSILKYNPRSYLTLKEGSINDEIRKTVIDSVTNEFALYNNGITFLSDDTYFNQRIGHKDKAQLSVKNPQIINGGQTAYTLSLLYEEALANDDIHYKLSKKEVLVKVITFSIDKTLPLINKLDLIERISEATNKQSQVNNADRSSNNPLLITAQNTLFIDFGLLLERKRGEFYDGLRYGYIEKSHIIDRGIFMRIAFSTIGHPVPPKKEKNLFTDERINAVLNDSYNFRKYFFGCLVFSELQAALKSSDISNSALFAIIAVISIKNYDENLTEIDLKTVARNSVLEIIKNWTLFEEYAIPQFHNNRYFIHLYNYSNKSYRITANFSRYYKSTNVAVDLNNFFFPESNLLSEADGVRKALPTVQKLLNRYLTLDLLEQIKPYINSSNWFDEETMHVISKDLSIDIRGVSNAIKLITSKSYGFYFSKDYELTKVSIQVN